MNKRKKCFVYLVLLAVLMVFSACAFSRSNTPEAEEKYAVIIQDSDFFTADNAVASVKPGETFSTELTFEAGYYFESCNYSDCLVEKTDKGYKITLANIDHDYRIVVKSAYISPETSYPTRSQSITYYANGGSWEGEGEEHTENYNFSYHIRANTSTGKNLTRSGYTLIGWNTEADGSGEHVGLGSRTDYTRLYAEWKKWIDPSEFVYNRVDGGIALTGYKGKGDMEYFVIPETIDGLTVVSIESSFTTNIPCGTIESTKLVLPKSLKQIYKNAFLNSVFSEIYFYDTLEEVNDEAFSRPLTTFHINAGMSPVYQCDNDNARFADKVDYLMSQSQKRLVVFAGCSASYGICSELLEMEFNEYKVCNMGVAGGVNAIFQMQIIEYFLRDGDVFVHLPEQMSSFQLMSGIGTDMRIFIMVEGNYDLLALADFSYSTTVWENYNAYKREKNSYAEGSYSDARITYNQYGDIFFGRPYSEENAWEKDTSLSEYSYQFNPDMLTVDGIKRLCGFYGELTTRGVAVYISYAPVNINGLEDLEKAWQYESKFCQMLAEYGYKPIGTLEDHLFKGRYFYDSDYHLNNFGAILQTKVLIKELKKATVR